jgi:acyl-CoA thioester hydrolase
MSSSEIPANGIVTTSETVKPEWLDYNDHLNVAYYVMLFDVGIDAFKDVIGMGLGYIERESRSTVALESRIAYLAEASLGDALRIETRIIDFDGKRVHYYQEMFRGEARLALQETLSICFDSEARRSCPFPEDIARNFERMLAAQGPLGRPEWVGQVIGIRRKPSGA